MRVRRSGKEYEMTNKELEDYLRTTCPGRKNVSVNPSGGL